MSRRGNTKSDVFTKINMHDGNHEVCWEWQGTIGGRKDQPRPYFTVKGKKYIAYRLIYELLHGHEVPEGKVIRHTCDNGLCCNPNHHELGDHKENMKDMRDRERHGLPHHTVRAMRKLAKEGVSHAEIAERFGIQRRTATDAINGTTYAEVDDGDEESDGSVEAQ